MTADYDRFERDVNEAYETGLLTPGTGSYSHCAIGAACAKLQRVPSAGEIVEVYGFRPEEVGVIIRTFDDGLAPYDHNDAPEAFQMAYRLHKKWILKCPD